MTLTPTSTTTTSSVERMKKFGPYLIFLAAMLWATDAPFRVHLTKELPSSFIVLMEHFIDVLIILPFAIPLRHQIKNLTWKSWLAVLVIAIGGSALASFAFTQAFTYVNPSIAILLQKLQPLIAITLAAALLKESFGKRFWLWAITALFGAYLISFAGLAPHLFIGEKFTPSSAGIGFALIAAVLWGASTVFGKYALRDIDFKAMTSLRFIFGFIFLVIWNTGNGAISAINKVTALDWLYFIIIAAASGVVSLFIYYRGLAYTKASIATLAELGFPLAALVVNAIFLKATLVPIQLLGVAVLLFAIFKLGGVNRQPAPSSTPQYEI